MFPPTDGTRWGLEYRPEVCVFQKKYCTEVWHKKWISWLVSSFQAMQLTKARKKLVLVGQREQICSSNHAHCPVRTWQFAHVCCGFLFFLSKLSYPMLSKPLSFFSCKNTMAHQYRRGGGGDDSSETSDDEDYVPPEHVEVEGMRKIWLCFLCSMTIAYEKVCFFQIIRWRKRLGRGRSRA